MEAVGNTTARLHEAPCMHQPHAHLDEPVVAAEVGHAIHEFLQVQVQVLKHKVQPPVSMDDVMQPDCAECVQGGDGNKAGRRRVWGSDQANLLR
jgi:hypothetical protein